VYLAETALGRGPKTPRLADNSDPCVAQQVAQCLCQLIQRERDLSGHLRFHRKFIEELEIQREQVLQLVDSEQGTCAGMGGFFSPKSMHFVLVEKLQVLSPEQCKALLWRVNPTGACLVAFDAFAKYLSPSLPCHVPRTFSPHSAPKLSNAGGPAATVQAWLPPCLQEPSGPQESRCLKPRSPSSPAPQPRVPNATQVVELLGTPGSASIAARRGESWGCTGVPVRASPCCACRGMKAASSWGAGHRPLLGFDHCGCALDAADWPLHQSGRHSSPCPAAPSQHRKGSSFCGSVSRTESPSPSPSGTAQHAVPWNWGLPGSMQPCSVEDSSGWTTPPRAASQTPTGSLAAMARTVCSPRPWPGTPASCWERWSTPDAVASPLRRSSRRCRSTDSRKPPARGDTWHARPAFQRARLRH